MFDAPTVQVVRALGLPQPETRNPRVSVSEDLSPLNDVVAALSNELDSDAVEARWLAQDGTGETLAACGSIGAEARDQVEQVIIETAKQRVGGARTVWRLLPDADRAVMIVTLPVSDGAVILSVEFAQVEARTRGRAGEALARLLPLVHPFFKSWVSRAALGLRLKSMTAVVDGSGVGVILVDRDGRVNFANTVASQLFDNADVLRCRDRTISAGSLADTFKLLAAVNHVISSASSSEASSAVLVHLQRSEGHPLLASVLAAGQAPHDDGSAAAVIYVIDTDRDLRALIRPVCKLFGMSPVEMRLACELAMGRSLAEAAKVVRIREATARSYMKQLFVKTSTHRQVDLVRLLVAGASGQLVHVTDD